VVLITDDHPDNRSLAIHYLQTLLPGLQFDQAPDGETALALVKEKILTTGRNYDFIMMDYEMPGMNGQETTFKIRELESSLKGDEKSLIITWSAAKTRPYQQADAILRKPLVKDELEMLLIEYGYIP